MTNLLSIDHIDRLSVNFYGFSAEANGVVAVVCLMIICLAFVCVHHRPKGSG